MESTLDRCPPCECIRRTDDTEMRQIRFNAEFWPEMHEYMQLRRAEGNQLDAGFHEDLAMTLSDLAADGVHIIRRNFVKYPFMEGDVGWRRAHVTQGAELVWKLTGGPRGEPMHQVAGNQVLVRGILFTHADGTETTVGYVV